MKNQPSQSNDLTKNGLHLKRPCLVIADLERSLNLYQNILGFNLEYINDETPNSYFYPVFRFPPEAKLTFAALRTDYEPRALGLTEVKGIELPPPSIPSRLALVIQVENLSETIAKIRELNLEIIPPHSFIGTNNLRFREQAFLDYDGHLLLLYEITKD